MGYPTDDTGAASSVTPGKLTLPTGAPIAAKPTALVTAEFNLDARAKDSVQAVAAGETPTPRSKYGTSITVYDSQGVASTASLYFEKTVGTPNSWDVYPGIDTTTPPVTYATLGTITFDAVTGKIAGLSLIHI